MADRRGSTCKFPTKKKDIQGGDKNKKKIETKDAALLLNCLVATDRAWSHPNYFSGSNVSSRSSELNKPFLDVVWKKKQAKSRVNG